MPADEVPTVACKPSWILVVEDNDSIREVIVQSLEIEGYSVKAACDGKLALELLSKTDHPCLIILDLMMPIMNGWEFLEAAKTNSIIASIPIVVVSAVADEHTVRGAERVLKKPVELEGLLKIVQHYCGAPKIA